MREGSFSENVLMVSSQFGFPIRVGKVGDSTLANLVSEISERFGIKLSTQEVARMVELTKMIDPVGRPFFACRIDGWFCLNSLPDLQQGKRSDHSTHQTASAANGLQC